MLSMQLFSFKEKTGSLLLPVSIFVEEHGQTRGELNRYVLFSGQRHKSATGQSMHLGLRAVQT